MESFHINKTPKDQQQKSEKSAPGNPFVTPKKQKSDRFITSSSGHKMLSTLKYLSNEKKRKFDSLEATRGILQIDLDETINQMYQDVIVNEMLPYASNINSTSPTILKFQNQVMSTRKESVLDKLSSSRLSLSSQKALQTPKKLVRVISKTPYKVLDAPELQDDFYLNLVDWSSTNFLGVGLGSCVYLWNANTSKVVKLCDLSPYDTITSVNWMQRGTHIAVGTNNGMVQLWDVQKMKKIRQFEGHKARVGSIAWNNNTLSSGSRDRVIYHRDVRQPQDFSMKLNGHRQEVCGLKWNLEGSMMASGGNDNKLFIWDIRNSNPLHKFQEHVAAVKAIAWSPHTHGLVASGGGTADRCIKFWNTSTNSLISSIDTGSQVCNLAWSKNSTELVSTHGYSQNQINIWKYPTMTQTANLTGHTFRVLYLAMSPDGQNIVTGAGDETLRFWTIFNKSKFRQNDSAENSLTIR